MLVTRRFVARTAAVAVVELVVILALSAPVHAQADNGWLGKRVVPKRADFRLPIGDQRIEPWKLAIYRVEELNGPWLRLKVPGEGTGGWAMADEMILAERANDYFNAYVAAHPNESDGYHMRAFLRRENGELDMALEDSNESIRLDPLNALLYVERGLIRDARKEYDKAIDDYSEAIGLDPQLVCAYSNRGAAWADKQEFKKAMADFGQAIQLDPKLSLHHSNRGLAWYKQRQYDRAIADCSEAIRLDPEYADAHFNRALARYCKRDFEKAIADLSQAIRLDPAYTPAYRNRAWIWATCTDARFRDGKRAVESASKACELSGWKQADPIGTLAAAYAEAGDFATAVQFQEKANRLLAESADKQKGEELLGLFKEKRPYRDEW
jgi:Tfp pilus assembly protein PilF